MKIKILQSNSLQSICIQDKLNINIKGNTSKQWEKLQSNHNDLEIYSSLRHLKNCMAES